MRSDDVHGACAFDGDAVHLLAGYGVRLARRDRKALGFVSLAPGLEAKASRFGESRIWLGVVLHFVALTLESVRIG